MDSDTSETSILTSQNELGIKKASFYTVCKNVPQRWVHGLHVLLGMTCYGFMIRVISVAVIPMTDPQYKAPSGINESSYASDSKINGLIYGTEFFGIAISSLISSLVIDRYPSFAKWIFCSCIVCPSIIVFFSPLLVSVDIRTLIGVRFVNGCFFGCLFGIFMSLIIDWAPRQEISSFTILQVTGAQLGSLLVQISAGFIVDYINWQAAFYFVGSFSLLSAVYLFIFMNSKPKDSSLITKKELDFIRENIKARAEHQNFKNVPWKHILKSPPVLVDILCGSADIWLRFGFYYAIPVYLNNISNFYMYEVGLIMSVIFLISIIFGPIVAYVSDKIIAKYENLRLYVRKGVALIGGLGQCTCYVVLTFSTGIENIAILALAFGVFHATFAVVPNVNLVEIAPRHVNILQGLSQFVRTLVGAFSPIVVGYIVTNKEVHLWNIVFYIYAGIMMTATVFFCLFGQTDIQPWSMQEYDELDESKVE